VDIDIEPSVPIDNQCGECRLCLDACPAGAAVGGRVVDARRCISYLTIEPSAEIPAESEKSLHGSLFGCDRCTAVCPWNKTATAAVMAEFAEKAALPAATEILAWTEEDFSSRFRGTAVYRTGLEHLKRNARAAVSS
jgi:epoxyqueuosine reductase